LPEKTETYEMVRHPPICGFRAGRAGATPAQRAGIGCGLNRLMLPTAGNEPKLVESFARAELKRGGCTPAVPSGASPDWVTSAVNPVLRGRL
jgi:hypothetical protein